MSGGLSLVQKFLFFPCLDELTLMMIYRDLIKKIYYNKADNGSLLTVIYSN